MPWEVPLPAGRAAPVAVLVLRLLALLARMTMTPSSVVMMAGSGPDAGLNALIRYSGDVALQTGQKSRKAHAHPCYISWPGSCRRAPPLRSSSRGNRAEKPAQALSWKPMTCPDKCPSTCGSKTTNCGRLPCLPQTRVTKAEPPHLSYVVPLSRGAGPGKRIFSASTWYVCASCQGNNTRSVPGQRCPARHMHCKPSAT